MAVAVPIHPPASSSHRLRLATAVAVPIIRQFHLPTASTWPRRWRFRSVRQLHLPTASPGHGGGGSDPSASFIFPPPPPGHGGGGSDPSANFIFPPPPPGHGGGGSIRPPVSSSHRLHLATAVAVPIHPPVSIFPPPPPGHGGGGSDPSANFIFPPPPRLATAVAVPIHPPVSSSHRLHLATAVAVPIHPSATGGASSTANCPPAVRRCLHRKGVAASNQGAAASATVVSVISMEISLSLFVRVDLIPARWHYDAPKVTIGKVLLRSSTRKIVMKLSAVMEPAGVRSALDRIGP